MFGAVIAIVNQVVEHLNTAARMVNASPVIYTVTTKMIAEMDRMSLTVVIMGDI